MGIVQDFFIQTFNSRRSTVGTNSNTTMQPILTNEPCLVTKREDKANEITDGYFGMARTLYCNPGRDVKVGDEISSGGLVYAVRGVDPNIPDMFENSDQFSSYLIILSNQ